MTLFKRFNEWLNGEGEAPASPKPHAFVTCGPCGGINRKHEPGCPVAKGAGRHWKLTGGSSDYYKVRIHSPTTAPHPYTAECNDIIEALQMNFAEGNAFKALWRKAAARLGNGKPGNTDRYDSEKIVFFGLRMLDMAKQAEQEGSTDA